MTLTHAILGATGSQELRTKNQYIGIQVTNTGANALTDFIVQIKLHPDGEFVDYITTWDESQLLFLDTSPVSLTTNGSSHFILDVSGVYSIRFVATSVSAILKYLITL